MKRYRIGKVYQVGRYYLKLWGFVKCGRRCGTCHHKLKFKDRKVAVCGYLGSMTSTGYTLKTAFRRAE